MHMKKTKFVRTVKGKSIVILLCLLITPILTSCTFDLLKTMEKIDPEVSKLFQAPVSAESYPDADVVYLLDEGVDDVFTSGRHKLMVHEVFKIISERGKDYANCEIGYNSRTETASLLYAKTITAEGKIIPLKKNAIKLVTPYSRFPNYSDYKRLTFSMPGAAVGCTIDYKYVIEEKEPTDRERNVYKGKEGPQVCSRKSLEGRCQLISIEIGCIKPSSGDTYPDGVFFSE